MNEGILHALAMRVAKGEAAAYASLVQALTPSVFRLCARVLGDTGWAEDVAQEAWMKVYAGLRDGRFDGQADVARWVRTIATREALNQLRSSRRRKARERSAAWIGDFVAPDAASLVQGRRLLESLAHQLDALPEAQRTVFVLCVLEGQAVEEAAAALGISKGAAEQRLFRARQTIYAWWRTEHES